MIEVLNKETLKRLYIKEGKSTYTIAKIFSCSPSTVLNRCREHRISLRPKVIKGLNRAVLHKLYVKEGKTIREVAKILGCSRETVRRRCKQFGIPLRNPGSKKIEIDESALRRLYVKDGKTLTEIAKIFNCAITTISRRIKQFGLKKELERD